jgi:hypothetical protein
LSKTAVEEQPRLAVETPSATAPVTAAKTDLARGRVDFIAGTVIANVGRSSKEQADQ